MVTDELAFTVLTLVGSPKAVGQSIQLLQLCLGIFISIRCTAGPFVKIFVECFVKQVFLKVLIDTAAVFAVGLQVAALRCWLLSVFLSVGMQANDQSDSAKSGGAQASFSLEEQEAVLESLCDLLADPAFLPALYLSFDCDPTKPDIAQPLVQWVCRCSRLCCLSGCFAL